MENAVNINCNGSSRGGKNSNRLYINVLRGIAIFLMLWGHCIQCCSLGEFDFFENEVFKIIYSFHMPLFMLISGYLFYFSMKRRDIKELLIHKTQSMLQPIIMCGFLCFLLYDVVIGVVNRKLADVLFGGGWITNHLTDYWFLWSVLVSSIIVGLAFKITNNKWISTLILLVGVLFVCMMPCAKMNLYMYPYFVIGCVYCALKDRTWVKKINFIKYITLILFPFMMLFYKKEHYIYVSGLFGDEGLIKHMPVNLYRWAIGLVGSVFVIVLLEFIFKLGKNKITHLKIMLLFERLGKKSLQVYTLSCIFLSRYLPIICGKINGVVGNNIFVKNIAIYNYIFTPVLALVYSIGILFIVGFFEKIKLSKILFGK